MAPVRVVEQFGCLGPEFPGDSSASAVNAGVDRAVADVEVEAVLFGEVSVGTGPAVFAFDAAGQGATAFNRKLIDIAQRNLNSGFDFAKSLAGAKTLAEIIELQSTYIRDQFEVFAGQATEIQELTKKIATDTSEPLKDQMTKSFEAVRKTA